MVSIAHVGLSPVGSGPGRAGSTPSTRASRTKIEYRFRETDGGYRWFLGKARRNEEGEIVQWFGTATDISARKRLEEEREQLLARERDAHAATDRRHGELKRVTESRAALIRGFSHDARNPLTVADMSAQLLELAELPADDHASIERIRRSIRTSLRLIDDLLEVARAEAGQLEITCVPTDVGHAAHELADDFAAPAAGRWSRAHRGYAGKPAPDDGRRRLAPLG